MPKENNRKASATAASSQPGETVKQFLTRKRFTAKLKVTFDFNGRHSYKIDTIADLLRIQLRDWVLKGIREEHIHIRVNGQTLVLNGDRTTVETIH